MASAPESAGKIIPEDGLVVTNEGHGPQTHVLLVGVGHYPYFREGGITANASAPLGQLTSTTRSARQLAKWFDEDYHYPAAPLGSLAWLSSEALSTPLQLSSGSWIPRDATYENLSKAAQAWKERANGDEENRLIFWFCGHGYGFGSETSLLCTDFDFRRDDRWDAALDLGTFVSGLETCAAAEQLYFIDACRKPHGDLVAPRAAIGRSPVHPASKPRLAYSSARNAPLIFSTGADEVARGDPDGVSIFTEAFLKSVRGMAARDDHEEWRVNNYSLLEAMSHVAKRLTEEEFPAPQQPQGGAAHAFDFHYLEGDPVSPIYVSRGDDGPCGPGILKYQLGGQMVGHDCAGEVEIEIFLPYGQYQFALEVGEGQVVATAEQRSAPTFKKARLV